MLTNHLRQFKWLVGYADQNGKKPLAKPSLVVYATRSYQIRRSHLAGSSGNGDRM